VRRKIANKETEERRRIGAKLRMIRTARRSKTKR
jgi:hypothetical protein